MRTGHEPLFSLPQITPKCLSFECLHPKQKKKYSVFLQTCPGKEAFDVLLFEKKKLFIVHNCKFDLRAHG